MLLKVVRFYNFFLSRMGGESVSLCHLASADTSQLIPFSNALYCPHLSLEHILNPASGPLHQLGLPSEVLLPQISTWLAPLHCLDFDAPS